MSRLWGVRLVRQAVGRVSRRDTRLGQKWASVCGQSRSSHRSTTVRLPSWWSTPLSSPLPVSPPTSTTPPSSESPTRRAGAGTAATNDASHDPKETLFGTIPNILTVTRIAASPVLCYWVVTGDVTLAAAGFLAAGLCDALDGYIARRFDQASVLGSFLDPIADKVLVGSLTLTMGVQGLLHPLVAGLILARDVALVGGVAVIRARTKVPDAPFFSLDAASAFQITPSNVSKANTAFQLSLLFTALLHAGTGVPPHVVVDGLAVATGVSTIWSGFAYADGSGLAFLRRLREKTTRRHTKKQKQKQKENEGTEKETETR